MRKEASFRMMFEKNDPRTLKKNSSSHYEEGEAPVEFVSKVEGHYHQVFISAEILH